MIAVGIDIGKRKHAFGALEENGREILKPKLVSNDRAGLEQMLGAIEKLGPREEVVVGMESTGAYWFGAHDFLVKAGLRVDVINPIVTSASIAGDIRGRKTDKTDALVIARVVLSGKTQERVDADADSRGLLALTRQRSFLVAARAKAKLHLESDLDKCFPGARSLFEDLFDSLALAMLKQYPTARALSRAHRPAVARIIKEHTRGRSDEDLAKEADRLVSEAKKSLAVDSAIHDEVGFCVQISIASIEQCDELIKKVDARIKEAEPPKLATLLESIKGIGDVLAMAIAAEIGDLSRFERNPKGGPKGKMWKRVLAFAGSEPRVMESGNWRGKSHMSKRGSRPLRAALFQAAFSIRRHEPYFKDIYDRKIAQGKHHYVALTYVSAEIVRVMCALWKEDRPFSAERPAVKKELRIQK